MHIRKGKRVAVAIEERQDTAPAIHKLPLREEDVIVSGSGFYLCSKRIFDIVMALVCTVILFVPMVFIGAWVWLDSKGPALFRQERLGKDGVPFTMYKFRTMYINAEENGPQWAKPDDERCTRLGRMLRKTRLDELPQLFNILRGDMSFVGPRPERQCFYEIFETYIPGFRLRMMVRPGLTGHAQVNGGYDLLPEEKIVYDMEYINKRCWKMDIQCLIKTVMVVLTRSGSR